jgi:alcohol dehydrogenase class IV
MAAESIERFDPDKEFPIITHGLPYPEACAKHLVTTLNRLKPFLVISESLSKTTDVVERLKSTLNSDNVSIVGTRIGMRPHTYYSEVLQVMREVKESGADAIVTVGGGSLIDGAKAVSLVSRPSPWSVVVSPFLGSGERRQQRRGPGSPLPDEPCA